MGVGGSFWDLLKPYTRNEGFDFLRDKRVAIDLSYWIVQHETAIKGHARNPHLRVTFFRTINLFSKFGAFPVFVLDGDPSPLKSRARIERFFRMSGIDLSEFPKAEEGVSIKRNQAFTKCVRECVELLELLGMPVLRARCEAEALCAQLNSEDLVDACITADSDAFLFGAKCVIKCLRPNSKEPFECYHISDVEAGLGLKRKQLVAISLLVGNDHDLHGVPGIGIDTALRFVQLFNEDEILDRLHEVGKRDISLLPGGTKSVPDCHVTSSDESLAKTRVHHCSHCGHLGSKRAHMQLACEYCNVNGSENCLQKQVGFKCQCSYCDNERRSKEFKKSETWQFRVCEKISAVQNFPNRDIIEMYLTHNHRTSSEKDGPLSWDNPKIEDLVDFLVCHQHWEPSYIRQRLLPMLSTIFLREMATNPKEGLLLCDQYEFHTIQRVKIRYGHSFYLVYWKRAAPNASNFVYTIPSEQSDFEQGELLGASEPIDLLDGPDVPKMLIEDGCWFLLTDENMELVEAAFPKKVDLFLKEKELRESKSRRRKSTSRCGEAQDGLIDKSAHQKPSGTQLSITEFYRSSKVLVQAKQEEEFPAKSSDNCADEHPKEIVESSTTVSTVYFSKSARRRLLFG